MLILLYNTILVAPGAGDHVISLVDEISFIFPPSPPISQIDDIPPEQFCNGDNKPANCGRNCMCTHKVDIPLNAVVEVVLVDEGKLSQNMNNQIYFYYPLLWFFFRDLEYKYTCINKKLENITICAFYTTENLKDAKGNYVHLPLL